MIFFFQGPWRFGRWHGHNATLTVANGAMFIGSYSNGQAFGVHQRIRGDTVDEVKAVKTENNSWIWEEV